MVTATCAVHFPQLTLIFRYTYKHGLSIFSALKGMPVKVLNVSYDISCQWTLHLWEWMETLPFPMHLAYKDKTVNVFIPKFHLPTHVVECQWKYCFNVIKGAG